MKFTEEYYPNLAELTTQQLADARAKVVAVLQPHFADIDLSPGTPTGDAVVAPLAAFVAASEEAHGRLMSDLDLENVANGLVYSCDFVQKYLGNFSVYDVDNLRSFGMVRLTFSSNIARTLDKSMMFRFGTDDEWKFKVSSEAAGVSILAAGSVYNGEPDTFVLSQTSVNTWAVDLPLEGVMTEAVSRGTAGIATRLPSDVVGIAASIDFMQGVPSAGIADLARMARRVFHALTANSRGGTSSLVLRHWPETNMVSPVVNGDPEMQRVAPGSSMILQAPAMDLYFRSNRDNQVETQVVKLYYRQKSPSDPTMVFRGHAGFLHRPSKILSVEWVGSTTTTSVASYKLFSASTRTDLYGSLACGSRYESLWLQVYPVLATGMSVIPRTGTGNDAHALFSVTYLADPLLEAVSDTMESPDNAPPGLDLIVKSGPLAYLDSMLVSYNRSPGTRMLLTTAQEKIAAYLGSAGYPSVFRQTAIHDIMKNAGAVRTTAIEVYGKVMVSPAGYRFKPAVITDPYDYNADWEAGSVTMLGVNITDISQLSTPTITNTVNGGIPEVWAATERNMRYYIDPANITFHEI